MFQKYSEVYYKCKSNARSNLNENCIKPTMNILPDVCMSKESRNKRDWWI